VRKQIKGIAYDAALGEAERAAKYDAWFC
jgi:hypothetical protein